jgi:xanthine dehydrogenase YagR molybdenum-binding subunit
MNAIGQPISRIDGRLKVTGGARYNADIVLAGAAHAMTWLTRSRRR